MKTNSWQIKRSILFELDTAFTLLFDYLPRASLSPAIQQLFDSVPEDLLADLQELLGSGRHYFYLLFPAGYAAGTEFEEDYLRATQPLRIMSAEDLTRRTLERAAAAGIVIHPDDRLSTGERMAAALSALNKTAYVNLGYPNVFAAAQSASILPDLRRLADYLAGGAQHDRFWRLIDRFYHTCYEPWRAEHAEQMNTLEQTARVALGADPARLAVEWLPRENPLRVSPELTAAAQGGGLNVTFLAEPFELADVWFALPGGVAVNFADNPESHQQFYAFVESLSTRLKALADPTRLMMMRIVRGAPRDNTEMAAFLGVSRPTVSIHARQMREAGLITTREQGRSVVHEVRVAEVRALFRDLERFLDLPPEEDPTPSGKDA